MQNKRARCLNQQQNPKKGPILYWMSRDQRISDNHALLFAQKLAQEQNSEVGIVFVLADKYIETHQRNYDFMLQGLHETSKEAQQYGFPFLVLQGDPVKELLILTGNHPIGCLVTDFDPIRIKRQWKEALSKNLNIPFYEVDTHNIVPAWETSNKKEYGAYTIRPKIHRLLNDYLVEPEPLVPQENLHILNQLTESANNTLPKAKSGSSALIPAPGCKAAKQRMHSFIDEQLANYDAQSNDPTAHATSGLSPYLHFGHIAALRVALEVSKAPVSPALKSSFLEELVIRKELSDNYCLYNPDYDTLRNIPDWAKITLEKHTIDEREYIYPKAAFEKGDTHDPLWNAAQKELLVTGKIHGYMRMYWAKKILEWTSSPDEALQISIWLNDTYALDGRDPNGYVGCAWSIAGVHDRAWTERPVFGKIRYMNDKGCKRKFDVAKYIRYAHSLK